MRVCDVCTYTPLSLQYKKTAERPPGLPASGIHHVLRDSLFVVAPVCCQPARPVSACQRRHLRYTRQRHSSGLPLWQGHQQGEPGMASASRRSRRGEKNRSDGRQAIRSDTAADVSMWYVQGGGSGWFQPRKPPSQTRPEDQVGGFTRRRREPW